MWHTVASAVDFVAALVLVCIATYAILSPKVSDGIVIKLGLIFVALGAAGMASALFGGLDAHDILAMTHATLMMNIGLLIVIVGVVMRLKSPSGKRRRITDWVPLDDNSGAQS